MKRDSKIIAAAKDAAEKIKPYLKNILWLMMSTVTTMYWYLDSSKFELTKKIAKKRLAHMPIGREYLHIRHALTEFDLLSLFILIAVYILYSKTPKYNGTKKDRGLAVFFSLLIPFITILCQSYDIEGNWSYVFGGYGAILLTLIKTVGFAMLIYSVLCFLSYKTLTVQKRERLRKPFNFKLDVLANTALLFIFWSPYFLLLFPGCFSPDAKDQMAQAINDPLRSWTAMGINLIDPNVIINTHHPVIYTYILKVVIKFAEVIGSYDWAFELLCIGQSALLALALGYLLSTLKRYGARAKFILPCYVFFMINPLFPVYGMTVIKDTIHIAFMVLAFVLTYEMLTVEKITAKRIAVYAAVMLLFALTRNNVVYVLVLALIVFAISLRKDKKRLAAIGGVMLATVLIVTVGFGMILYPALHISKGSTREVLAVPINQTARYVVEHKDEITPEEEEVILRIFNNNDNEEGTSLDIIAEKYDPVLSDPVKDMYNKNNDIDDLKDYFRVWFAQFKKHPDTYIQAYLNIHYGWFSFEGNNQIAYSRVQNRHIGRMIKGFTTHMGKEAFRDLVNYYESVLIKNPLTVPFLEMATYTWLYIVLLIRQLKHKKKAALLTCTLCYFNFLIYFAGPVAYLRYSIPMVCVAPFAIYISYALDEKRTEKQSR